MSANPEKFHGFIINICGRHNDVHKLNFAGLEILIDISDLSVKEQQDN